MSTYSIPINQTTTGNIFISTGGTGGGTNATWSVANNAKYTIGDRDYSNTAKVQIKGDCEFEGNITWKGRNMEEWFEQIESRLGMLQPNTRLEAEYDELKALSDQYRALEKRLLEQQQVFDILKKPID